MRRIARTDDNQVEIVEALRDIGATVQVLSQVGDGCPDLAVGFRGVNHFLEVKDGRKEPRKRRLTPDEARWHARWQGQVSVVESVTDALRVLGVL